MTNILGTARDSEQLRNKLQEVQDQTRSIIRDTSSQIKQVGMHDIPYAH